MSENSFDGWNEVIKNTPLKNREPMWDQAIKFLVTQGAMEPTMYDTLTQGQIQEIILERSDRVNLCELFVEMLGWMRSAWGEIRFYVMQFQSGNELWLAYLMAVYYAMEWDGEKWVGIA